MATAYVLINSDLGTDESVIAEVRRILDSEPGVEYELQGVYGVYDIVAKVSAGGQEALRSVITGRIRRIPKVQSTLTMMVVEGQGGGAR